MTCATAYTTLHVSSYLRYLASVRGILDRGLSEREKLHALDSFLSDLTAPEAALRIYVDDVHQTQTGERR